MPWRKVLQVTSKWHAVAVSYYVFQTALGLTLTISTQAPIKYIADSASPEWAKFWALALLIGGVLALTSMFFKDVEEYLRIEAVASLVIGVMMTWIFVAMLVTAKPTPFGVLLVAHFAAGGIARCIQTIHELMKVRKAKRNPLVATGTDYLATPSETDN